MLEGLMRELSNWPKGRRKTVETTFYIEETDGLLDALKRAAYVLHLFSDIECRAIKDYNPYAYNEKHDDVLYPYPISSPMLEQGIVPLLLWRVCLNQKEEESQGFIVNVQHQVYAGKNDERHYIDVLRRSKGKQGMPKVMALEFTITLCLDYATTQS